MTTNTAIENTAEAFANLICDTVERMVARGLAAGLDEGHIVEAVKANLMTLVGAGGYK